MEICRINYNNPVHNTALVRMMDAYVREITGNESGLSDNLKGSLVSELSRRPGITVLLAMDNGTAAGFAIALEGFSTFTCKPVLNIHDMFVDAGHRSKGAARMLLDSLDVIAAERKCSKLTLEVLEKNTRALKLYESCGYAPHMQNPALGRALFYEKKL